MEYILTFEKYQYNFTSLLSEIDNFIKSIQRNSHVSDDMITMYIRKSKRYVNGVMDDFIDIASISIDESLWGKKIFTNLIDQLIKIYPDRNFYVESILNPAVETVIKKFGFIKIEGEDINYYRMSK